MHPAPLVTLAWSCHVKEKPNHPPRQPTPKGSCPVFPRRPQCLCRTYICSRRHSPLVHRTFPSIHLLPAVLSHLWLFSPDTAFAEADEPARLQDNVELWYAGNQNHGNSGYPWVPATHPLPVSG